MPRVVSLFLPTWSTDRVRRKAGDAAPPPETPLVLVGRDGRRRVVLAADAAAQAAGLRVGMPATKAQALVPGLVIQDADPAADAAALERLALWMLQRYAPIVAADPPDGIVIDSTGADHLHGGEAAMLATWSSGSPASGFAARAAIADTWGAAHALARYRRAAELRRPRRERGARRRAVADRGAAAAAEHGRAICACSASTASAICWRSRARRWRCASALSSAAASIRRLGRLAEPIEPIRPEALIEVRRAFAEPIGAAETIARYIGKLVVPALRRAWSEEASAPGGSI